MRTERFCKECGGKYYSKGLCFRHYLNQLRASRKKVSLVKEDLDCYVSSCDRKAKARGLCQAHYVQRLDGRPFSEIRRRVIEFSDESGRVCTECSEYKTYRNFYRTSNGKSYRAKCKECTIKLNTMWNRKRTRT